MDLTERQKKVLYCIVKEYISNKTPVSSKRVLETATIERSGATIRNDMHRLMKLGYIYQPHTSAGRVPTDKGLRFYVNELLKIREEIRQRSTQVETVAKFPIGDMEKVLSGAARLLSSSTKGFVVIEKPSPLNLRIKRIVITPVSKTFSIANVITTLGLSSSIPLSHAEVDDLTEIERVLNRMMSGITLSEFKAKLKTVLSRMSEFTEFISENTVKGFIDIVERLSFESYEDYLHVGIANLVANERVREDKIHHLIAYVSSETFFKELFELKDGIYIGKEHGLRFLEDFSVIVGRFKLEERPLGRVATVFDKYGDYDSVIESFEYMLNRLSEYFTVVSRNVE
uniref:Heat-inducible transcription repressor HrcA n=1 Tax=Fervidobacterium thailandense TaxID=1008305 RepID=A0A7C5VQ10_9BACT